MSKVKYRVREYTPTSAQQGSHSFFAEAVINNEFVFFNKRNYDKRRNAAEVHGVTARV